ncbi:NAD(P)-dependent oxidoreductase [Yoonia sp. SS1-5]|uniref:NAD(P)-dependent oxidoreductase n=1 Tax=Yoonia rhodophyticola TaxID=3137370 RepID=A0AAN0MBZ8_9RHOB
MKYGVIGLGNLGGNLAASLARNGFDVVVCDKNPAEVAALTELGAAAATDPAAIAAACDAIITCLPSPTASETVLDQILTTARPGSTWIEMSTLGRDDILRLSAKAAAKDVRTLECPVTGGVHLAATGDITVLVGGDHDLFAVHEPALQALGGKIIHMGPLGSAAVIKVITNMLAFIHLVAGGEAMMLAKRAGLDLTKAWQAIAASSGNSFVHETEGQLILNGSYDVAFTMDLALKDLGFAADFSAETGTPLAVADLVHEIFKAGKTAYGGAAQSTQIVKLLEDALGTDLRAPGFPARL